MDRVRLTKREQQTIRLALNYAADERESLAAAYNYKGPEAKKALAIVKRFRKLHQKLFNEATQEEKFLEWAKEQPTVSVQKLMDLKKAQDFIPPAPDSNPEAKP